MLDPLLDWFLCSNCCVDLRLILQHLWIKKENGEKRGRGGAGVGGLSIVSPAGHLQAWQLSL